ncbi:MAG: ROK family protein [Actinomycetota bacterium]|nr:ROK family protein [Actinomycetota bacterium]
MNNQTTTGPAHVRTLAVDIGGSGVKASVLNQQGEMVADRVRIDTPYPCPPATLVSTIEQVVSGMRDVHRASVGFPGLVRGGYVVEVPSLSRREYDGELDPELTAAWAGFDLGGTLAKTFEVPTKVVNDADMQGCAVVKGGGLEFVMTLGTGVGTALFYDSKLLPHLELSHGRFSRQLTIDKALGNVELKNIGNKEWAERVKACVDIFAEMLWFDHIYIGGGNARLLKDSQFGPKTTIISNSAGIIGGVRVWELDQQ